MKKNGGFEKRNIDGKCKKMKTCKIDVYLCRFPQKPNLDQARKMPEISHFQGGLARKSEFVKSYPPPPLKMPELEKNSIENGQK